MDLRQKNILPKLELFCDALGELARCPKRRSRFLSQGNRAAACGIQPVRATMLPAETAGKDADGIKVALKIGKRGES